MIYTGHKCIVCGKYFAEDDDVVVCVECGTPYHRECYKEKGCINEELHRTHISWKQANEKEEEPAVVCRACGNTLRPGQAYCDKCGAPAAGTYRPVNGQAQNPANYSFISSNILDVDPTEEIEKGVTLNDLSSFVGSSTPYYIPRFSLMHKFGMKIGLNFGAMFFPELYFAYRKMPLIAILLFVLRLVVDIPSMLLTIRTPEYSKMFMEGFSQFPELVAIMESIAAMGLDRSSSFMTLCTVTSLLDTAICIAMGFYANYLYYRFAVRSVSSLKSSGNASFIPMAGGTSVSLCVLFVLMMSMKFIVILYIVKALLL
ncbi:MAG: DUF2628 domain-containing protein [Oscillospiraceae bacterium]|nr:DUF2628 domain-containing protein [Oscillospiraceae bacterium]